MCILLTITGNGDEVYSEDVLESNNVYLLPKLTPSKADVKGDQDRHDEQHPPKVCGGILLRSFNNF